ncbi:winged helix-turn-helix domain-containing tetratricopeptide repeat protein [Aestuariivirga litoralis]|uniref:winged helix-turn-helix domain-containing tetratricopeptide repeat protein n=1 Tax=Aestuariivirga litoralis TaxID=2650924 RepID=UPI0018C4F53A|nr:winged helix-turn-helix domain-containing protein [Aestuariivirga litoralis]MBG1232218.1 hypothetical protein [Aestuariivirga litoralis]
MASGNHVFGTFVFDTQHKLLLKNGAPVHLGQKCLLLLQALLEARGRAVSKSDLMLAAWKTDNIEESNLAVQISALRKCLGQTRLGGEWVTTVQRHGYQFVDPDRLDPLAPLATDTMEFPGDRPSLAVLPFTNLGSDPEQDFFSDGITSDIIIELSRWRRLSVRSRSASFPFRATQTDLSLIARQLKVRYVVDGSVRRTADRIRINVELVDVESGNQVWSEKFDCAANEIFSVQDQVVRTIVSTLVGRVIVATLEQTNRKPPKSLAAYECVLKGNALSWSQAAGEAKLLFSQAVEIDPNYGLAHALLGMMLFEEWHQDLDNMGPVPQRALDLAKRAVELDSNESTCFSILALLHLANRSFDPAIQFMQRAIDLNPNNQWNVADMGIVLHYLGQTGQALEAFKRAREIDPFFDPPWYFLRLGQTYMAAHRYEEALAKFELCPVQTFRVLAFMAAGYARAKRPALAASCVSKCMKVCPGFSISKFVLKEPYRDDVQLADLKESLALAGFPH